MGGLNLKLIMINYLIQYYNDAKKYLIICFLLFWIPAFLNGFYLPILSENLLLFLLVDILQWTILPIIALDICIRQKKIIAIQHLGFHNLIFHRRNSEYVLLTSFAISFLLFFCYFEAYRYSKLIFPINYLESFAYQSVIPYKPFLLSISIVLYMSFSAGLIEETFYRGLLKVIFQDDFHFNYKYILVSSFLFSINHWEGGVRNLFATFIFGIVTSILYLKIKNIWPIVIGHTIIDIYALYPHSRISDIFSF